MPLPHRARQCPSAVLDIRAAIAQRIWQCAQTFDISKEFRPGRRLTTSVRQRGRGKNWSSHMARRN